MRWELWRRTGENPYSSLLKRHVRGCLGEGNANARSGESESASPAILGDEPYLWGGALTCAPAAGSRATASPRVERKREEGQQKN